MTSEDRIVAEINGLKGYIDVKIAEIDGKITVIDTKIDGLKTEMQMLDRKIEINATKIDMLQHFQTIGFTVMGAVIGFAVLILGVAPAILDMFRDKRREKREEDIRGIVREEIARLKGIA